MVYSSQRTFLISHNYNKVKKVECEEFLNFQSCCIMKHSQYVKPMVVLIKTMHQVRVFEQNKYKIDVGTGQHGQTIG